MSNRPSTGAGTRHSSRIAGSASATSSIRKRSAAEPLSPPSSPKQRKRVDLAEMKELCNELLTRRLRQLTLLRDRRREIVAEQHFFRNNGSAVDFSSWMADVAPNDATLDAVVQTELGELDVGDIETRLLGIPLSRIALSPTVKQESAASATPSTSAASIRSQLEVVVTPTTIEPPSAAMTVRSPSTASVSSFSAPSKSVAVTDSIAVKIEPESSAPVTPMPTPSMVTSASVTPFVSAAPSPAMRPTPTATPSPAEGSVERAARQEAEVLNRIAELRRQGLWSRKRLPMCVEPARSKTHWDYLLEEMRWMAMDFAQERRFKVNASRKFASTIARLARDKEQETMRADQRAIKEAKRVCALLAKMVREFWVNVDKVVDARAQGIIEAKKRKALDQHLDFIVGQADKFSSMVQEGMAGRVSTTPSLSRSPSVASKHDDENDKDFQAEEASDDDESTIAKAERKQKNVDEEVSALQKECDLELDDILDSLPADYFENRDRMIRPSSDVAATSSDDEDDDESDSGEEGSEDEEETPTADTEMEASTSEKTPALLESIDYDKLRSDSSDERQNELAHIAEEAQKFQPKGHTLETTQVHTPVPFLLRGTLREYQHVGLDWLVTLHERNLNGILADEMGLGKTIQTIAVLAHLACEKNVWGPHLIVVPTSVILNWEMELKKWCPAFKILTYFGQRKERHEKRKGWSKTNAFHVCITSYKLVTQDIRVFKQKRWEYFVLDEAQNIKNFKSQRWQLLLNMNAKRRLLLTGTPLQNSLMELWSLMHFLMPSIFASNRDFKDWFSNPLTGMIEGSQDYNAQLVQRLHKVLRPFILRRMKAQVEKQLPQKHEHIISCPLSKRQRYLYDDFMSRGSTKDNLRSGNVMSVLNIVMQLRKCCNHPNLFEPRPIVSPFAMQPIRRHLPSMLFDLVRPDPVDDFCVPQLFLLNGKSQIEHLSCKRLAADKTLIEEIDSSGDAKPPKLPSVAGFKFVRPVQMASIRSPEMGHANSRASANHGPLFKVNSEDIPSLGLSDSDANHFWLEVNGERKGRVPIQMQLPTNVLAKQNIAGAPVVKPQGRIFQLVTNSAGERTIHAIGEGGSSSPVKTGQILIRPAGSAAAGAAGGSATSSSATPFAPRITVVKVTTGSNLQAVIQSTTQTFSKTAKVQVRSAAGGQQPPQLVVQRVIGQQRVGTTLPYQLTARAATNLPGVNVAVRDEQPNSSNAPSMIRVRPLMSADRTPQTTAQGTPIVVMTPQTVDTTSTSAPATPQSAGDTKRPVVKRKMVPSPTERLSLPPNSNQNHPVILPNGQPPTTTPDVSRSKRPSLDHLALAETAERQLNWHKHNLRRLALENVRRLCNAVLPVVSSEAIALFTKWTDRSVPVDLTEELLEWTNSLVAKFVLYVHRAVTDAPLVDSTSKGRSAFCRFEDTLRSDVAHRICSDSNALSTRVDSAKMLQFPELRLIEYDCGKLQALNQLLRRLKTGKHRCLIFTQMSKMLDVLEAFLCHHGYQYFRLDGATKIEQRQVLMERFNADPRIFCFILSTRSGGIGVNLTGADTVIFYDSDWNPTMDAQAQDRCHRIGQTRDVHIYRLISERTIEENILKKATQKRKLGEIAIEEAGFTPDYFKQSGLRDLFDLGADDPAAAAAASAPNQPAPIGNLTRQELEQAMLKLEDTQDAVAAKKASEEARAELAEFDENVAIADSESTKADSQFTELMKQLKPIERYAINFLEAEYKPDFEEEVKETENMIEAQKEEWVKAHERAMQGEMERQEAEEMADFDLTYMTASPCGLDEMFCPMSFDLELMPVWMPPSPPISDAENDLYLDPTFDLFYEREQMPESKLPSLIHELLPRSPVKMERENKPPATPGGLSSVDDAIDSVRRQSIQKTQRPQQPPLRSIEKGQQRSVDGSTNAALSASAANSNYSPKSLFDGGPTSKNRTDVRRPFTPPPAFKEDDQYEGPEWSIVEDYALLLAITEEQHMTYNLLTGGKFGHVPNWDYVAGFVNRITGHYRSPRQCSMRYQLAVLPREEGRLVAYDPVTKKARKVHLSTTEVVHMKRGRTTTTQQFEADGQKLLSGRTAQRFKAIRAAKLRRPLPMKRNIAHTSLVTLVGRIPQQQDLKLSEWGIRYSAVQQPQEHAEYREERQLERKKLQQESARLKQQADQQRQAEQAALEQQQQRQQQVQQRQSAIPPPPGSSFTTEQPTARAHAGMETTNTALVDHQQMTATSTVQPVQRQASMQRQVSTGMPYTVVVSTQDSVVASGGRLQPISTSGSYGQYPVVSRQLSQPIEQVGTTAYRQIAPQVGKSTRTPPSTPMPVNYVQQGTHQVYATARSSSGQQQIVQGGAHHSIQIEPSSSSGSGEQLQLVRPVVAQQAAGQRQTDIRPKVLQQRVNRVILTTTAPPTDQQRAYIVPQGQGMRAVQARSGQGYSVARKATLPAIKALAGGQQQSVATVMLQGGTRVPAGQLGQLQQVRAVPRQNFTGSQGASGQGKIPPIGMLIGPVARNETIGGSGTTMRIAPQQVVQQQQQQQQGGGAASSSSAAARSADGSQASLPPISLSTSSAKTQQQPPARHHPEDQ